MATYGNLRTFRFINHVKTTEPSQSDLDEYYANLTENNKLDITNQTGTADWFKAKLDDPPGFGGDKNEEYIIFNPTRNGKAVTSKTHSIAKICAAPVPPFTGGEDLVKFFDLQDLLKELEKITTLLKK